MLSKLISALKKANYARLRKRREPERIAYQQWVARHDTLNEARRRELQALHEALPHKPLLSVIMPVYNPNLSWLNAAIESLKKQIYQEWELCIADDCSPNPETRGFLESKASEDSRLKVIYRPQNGHISAASNSAISIASGQFLAFMDQDDLVSEDALLLVAQCINQYPNAQLIYSDEDKISETGLREAPTSKGPWRQDLVSKLNRICHLAVYKKELIEAVGGLKTGYEGAQDHDLVLRCISYIHEKNIHYIPKILYHWRIHDNSTAYMKSSKPYAEIARLKALKDHSARR